MPSNYLNGTNINCLLYNGDINIILQVPFWRMLSKGTSKRRLVNMTRLWRQAINKILRNEFAHQRIVCKNPQVSNLL